jgi:uncharacterized protein
MAEASLAAVFLVGLLGGVHCAGMCGGIVSALSSQPVVRERRWPLHLAYNLGRIASYAAAGAIAGSIAGVGLLFRQVLPLQTILYVLANVMLILLGLYLAGWSSLVARLEPAGFWLWKRISPHTRRLLPADTLPRAAALGMLWGWLPCGLVYSVLAVAMVSGSAASGALTMLAFGLGTVPNLLFAGLLLAKARKLFQAAAFRTLSGAIVLGFGVAGLADAAQLTEQIRRGILCFA